MQPSQAMQMLRDRGVLTMESLVETICGERVRGSWWGHPRGQEVFRVASALDDSDEVLTVKLVEGKVTFVHRALWPAVYRIVTDADWRRVRIDRLGHDARRLLESVELAGEMRADHAAAGRRARVELERSLLVWSAQVHTEKGKHVTVLRTWQKWGQMEASAALTLQQALAAIREACAGDDSLG